MSSINICVMTMLLLLHQMACSNAAFAEYPSSVHLNKSEMEAVFRCRHNSTNVHIIWHINGSSVGQYPGIRLGTLNENGTIVSTMTIQARPEYNGTEVECFALVSGFPPDITPVALLTISTTSTMPATPESIIEDILTVEPIPVNLTGFDEIPSPVMMIATPEETHYYKCNHTQTNRISWLINGSRLNIEIFPLNIGTAMFSLPNGGRVYTLTIGGLQEHNETTIQCVATITNSDDGVIIRVATSIVEFKIQGSLRSIANLDRRKNTITWDAPFSLNLTNADPDVVYCVEVYNITCGRSLLISECDVMETSYANDALLPGYIYEYTVTPRSNVERASNGTSLTTREQFAMQMLQAHDEYSLGIIKDCVINTTLKIYLNTDNIIANSYILLLNVRNVDSSITCGGGLSPVPVYDIMRNGRSIALATQMFVPFRNLWSYTVLAYGCDEHHIEGTFQLLSTYDIQNVSITSPSLGQIRVICDFIDKSTATGILNIVYSLNDSVILYSFASHSIEKGIEMVVSQLPSNYYGVSVFVTIENELPFLQVASMPEMLKVHSYDAITPALIQHQLVIEYALDSTSTGVCITCTFLSNITTDCIAVVHQRISQLSSSGLMNINSSYKFNRSGDVAYGCIEGVNLTIYQIGVIGGVEQIKSAKRISIICKECIISAVIASPLAVILVGILILSVMVFIKNQRNPSGIACTSLIPKHLRGDN